MVTAVQVYIGVHRDLPVIAGTEFTDACEALDQALTNFGGVVHEPWRAEADGKRWTRYYRNPTSQILDTQYVYRFPLQGIATIVSEITALAQSQAAHLEREKMAALVQQRIAGPRSLRWWRSSAAWKQMLADLNEMTDG